MLSTPPYIYVFKVFFIVLFCFIKVSKSPVITDRRFFFVNGMVVFVAKEIERSFKIDIKKITDHMFLLDSESVRPSTKRIHQNYLTEINSKISYDIDYMCWVVTLIHAADTVTFTVVVDAIENEEIVDALSVFGFDDLECGEKTSARIRLIGNEVRFTYKACGENPIERSEFEYVISDSDIRFKNGDYFTTVDQYCVKKTRHTFVSKVVSSDGHNVLVEIDEFDDINIGCFLEAEFPTIEEAKAFDFSKWFVGEEITGVAGYTNKELAVAAGTKRI